MYTSYKYKLITFSVTALTLKAMFIAIHMGSYLLYKTKYLIYYDKFLWKMTEQNYTTVFQKVSGNSLYWLNLNDIDSVPVY